MPNIPSTGAAGQIPFKGDKPSAGKQEKNPDAPKHGAAGGYDIPFGTHGASPTEIRLGENTPKGGSFDPVLGG